MTRSKNRCTGGGRTHRFEPRYDERPNSQFAGFELSGFGPTPDLRAMMVFQTYVHDICIWCGETIKREEQK